MGVLLGLHPVDRADVFNLMTDAEQAWLLPLLDVPTTADLLEELEDVDVLAAIESLSTERLADVLDEMEPDEAADLLGNLSPEHASAALAEMEEADDVIPLLGYPDQTAGGLMTTSYIALRRQTTSEQAIQFLRQISPETEIPYYLYVVAGIIGTLVPLGLRAVGLDPALASSVLVTAVTDSAGFFIFLSLASALIVYLM